MTVAILGTLGAACCANAQDSTTTTTTTTTTEQTTRSDYPLYRAQEFSLDLFGSGSLGEQTIDHISGDRVQHNGRLGAGAGLNYFFCRYVGIGGDAYTENTEHNFVDQRVGKFDRTASSETVGLRLIFSAAGAIDPMKSPKNSPKPAAALRFRVAKHLGFFVDARYVFADKTEGYGLGRGGVRLNF